MSAKNMHSQVSWIPLAVVAGAVIAASAGLYLTTSYLRTNHEQVQRLRNAKRKYRELLAELSESKGILNYIDTNLLPQAQELAKPPSEGEDVLGPEARKRELIGIGEQLLRLMEKIDGVAPALVVDAAGLEPWAEHDADLKQDAVRRGLGQVLDLAGDIRAIRKSLIQKAERRAKRIDALKASIES
ncbi:hypothetical protein GGF43_002369 [Coemansia sp. RSA 2618]|nr:hypothetical protein GGF43_002369 [Coemansia sp. RSA 2618]